MALTALSHQELSLKLITIAKGKNMTISFIVWSSSSSKEKCARISSRKLSSRLL